MRSIPIKVRDKERMLFLIPFNLVITAITEPEVLIHAVRQEKIRMCKYQMDDIKSPYLRSYDCLPRKSKRFNWKTIRTSEF
jgi:hypothetical protein